MLVQWMPYLRIHYGHGKPKELAVGSARFIPDTPENWLNETGQPRPQYLELFKDFPAIDSEVGDPAYGTLALSDDDDWLERHTETAVAVLYFLGDKTPKGLPAEVFTYKPIGLKSAEGNALVQFNTKYGPLTESGDSIVLYPPLGVRGNHSEYRVDAERPEHAELLQRFATDPDDRIAVAVRHFFRSQFSDVFTGTFDSDFTSLCSATEAALDVAIGVGTGDEFVRKLTDMFGSDQDIEYFFLGWYGARSRHVHGSPSATEENETEKKRARAFRLFQQTRCRWSVLRAVARETILRALGYQEPERSLYVPPDLAHPYLETALHSDDVWGEVRRTLTKCNAAKEINCMSDEEFQGIRELADRMKESFDWNCVQTVPEDKHVFQSLITCAICLGHLTGSQGDVYAGSDALGNAADKGDVEEIHDWYWTYLAWKDCYTVDRTETMQSLMWHIASYYGTR